MTFVAKSRYFQYYKTFPTFLSHHLHTSVCEEDGPVRVDVDQGAVLIEVEGCEGDAELDGDHGQASLLPPVLLVKLGHLRLHLVVV